MKGLANSFYFGSQRRLFRNYFTNFQSTHLLWPSSTLLLSFVFVVVFLSWRQASFPCVCIHGRDVHTWFKYPCLPRAPRTKNGPGWPAMALKRCLTRCTQVHTECGPLHMLVASVLLAQMDPEGVHMMDAGQQRQVELAMHWRWTQSALEDNRTEQNKTEQNRTRHQEQEDQQQQQPRLRTIYTYISEPIAITCVCVCVCVCRWTNTHNLHIRI